MVHIYRVELSMRCNVIASSHLRCYNFVVVIHTCMRSTLSDDTRSFHDRVHRCSRKARQRLPSVVHIHSDQSAVCDNRSALHRKISTAREIKLAVALLCFPECRNDVQYEERSDQYHDHRDQRNDGLQLADERAHFFQLLEVSCTGFRATGRSSTQVPTWARALT
jgi:hypothetical protein